MMWCVKISCQKANLKPILTDYIYHKNEKGKTLKNGFSLLKNDISNFLGS